MKPHELAKLSAEDLCLRTEASEVYGYVVRFTRALNEWYTDWEGMYQECRKFYESEFFEIWPDEWWDLPYDISQITERGLKQMKRLPEDYRPGESAFEYACRRSGFRPDQVLQWDRHGAYFYDVAGYRIRMRPNEYSTQKKGTSNQLWYMSRRHSLHHVPDDALRTVADRRNARIRAKQKALRQEGKRR